MTSGSKPPSEYCPIIEGFCSYLKCSTCNYLYNFYEDVEWICITCNPPINYEAIGYTDITFCEHCECSPQICNAYIPGK